MSLGPLMIDVMGTELGADDRELLVHPLIGGVILFSRNFESLDQLQTLTRDIHELRSPHLLIAIDQEGGRVQRIRAPLVELPAAHLIGRHYDVDSDSGLDLAEKTGWLMAAELRALGVDFSFAPVLDLDWGLSEVIGDRAFHRNPEVVGLLTQSWIKGMKRAGMASVGKHFPGHGAVTADSHHALPTDRRDYSELLEDILPFERLITAGLNGVMSAHVVYSQLDPLPATFSRYWLHNELRQRLRFNGVIFSDDLSMEGAAVIGDMPERSRKALDAGCDVILLCNDRDAVLQVIESLGEYSSPVSQLRLVRLHGRDAPDRTSLLDSQDFEAALAQIGHLSDQPRFDLDA